MASPVSRKLERGIAFQHPTIPRCHWDGKHRWITVGIGYTVRHQRCSECGKHREDRW